MGILGILSISFIHVCMITTSKQLFACIFHGGSKVPESSGWHEALRTSGEESREAKGSAAKQVFLYSKKRSFLVEVMSAQQLHVSKVLRSAPNFTASLGQLW